MIRKILLSLFFCTICAESTIHVNQIGYYPNGKKTAIITDTSIKTFSVKNITTGELSFTGNVSPKRNYPASGEYTVIADFTELRTAGNYRVIAGSDSSYQFTIQPNIHKDALKKLIRSYYYQRCSMALAQQYAGDWARAAGHPDSSLQVIDAPLTTTTSANVTGGWYDAGDYGKYVVNSGITCGTMLSLMELCPSIVSDSLGIPESGNGKSDLLDEIKYNIDWMIRMQDIDGGVFFKVGPDSWPGPVAPANDPTDRFIIGKSTTSTLDFAAVLAMAGRIYKKYDSLYAAQCLAKAESAWNWAIQHKTVTSPTNVDGSGPYQDGNDLEYSDEFFWAASELFISSGGKQLYKDTLDTMLQSRSITGYGWWQNVNNLGFFSLALHLDMLSDKNASAVRKTIVSYADILNIRIGSSGYMSTMNSNDFSWGSSGNAGNQAVVLLYAHYLTKKQTYLDGCLSGADFLFGKNATGYSFATGLGSKSPISIHHRPSQGDNLAAPVPGLVVGGPNKSPDDAALAKVVNAGTAPAKCYVDTSASYASNEVAINQNAPFVLLLGYLEQYADSGLSTRIMKKTVVKLSNTSAANFTIKKVSDGIAIVPTEPLKQNAIVSLYTISGKLVKSFTLTPQQSKKSIQVQLASGQLYLVKLTSSNVRTCRSILF